MLGTELGHKVSANFVQKGYEEFLIKNKKPPPTMPKKKPMTKEQKRAEMRKRGIFVEADDTEMDYSDMEKMSFEVHPAVCHMRTRKLRWKTETPAEREDSPNKERRRKSKHKKRRRSSSAEKSEKKKESKESTKEGAPGEETTTPPVPKEGESSSIQCEPTQASTSLAIAPKEGEGGPPSLVAAPTEDSTSLSIAPEKALEEKAKEQKKSPVRSPETISTTAPVTTTTTPADDARSKRDDIFAELEEDVDLTKVLGDFDTESVEGVGASDRRTLEAAKKILKIAHREKAIEKTLTKEENEIVSKFFSGKIPYDQNVLNVLDRVLDKTIEYLQTHGANLDPETKRLIEKRKALKAAMLETMLSTPKFIPNTWVQHYDRLHKQAMQDTKGINWARVILFYPRQRSFDDGEADIFGNFTRNRNRHWILGVILGPNDSKSFEETEREKQSKGLFMDTVIMENAKNERATTTAGTTTSLRTDVSETRSLQA
ncbi:unnamed protein product [Cylicocyclus nassatus]|uniref:DUF7774 domain-containing protein n=1 Tax=Cylicocyclus nassatus TaxID=53992 RepID=A0AA36DVR8_CYLNA|nr:unnamed protein product [Cylicocyclus nassatus]